MDQDKKEEFIRKMNKLKRLYDAYLNEWRIELEKLQSKIDEWTLDDTTSLQMIVHKLTGTGATYGYPQVSESARALEYKLAYANVEFKVGGNNPNKNSYIRSELASLIRICNDIYAENQVSRLEKEMFGDEMDEFLGTQKIDPAHKTILVVDDQEIIRFVLHTALQEAGFNTIMANDGDDALLIMQKTIPDLVVLDRLMPHLDGMTVLKTMRKVKELQKVPVMFLTALYNPTDILEAQKLGVVDYVTKPFDVDEFTMRCLRHFQ